MALKDTQDSMSEDDWEVQDKEDYESIMEYQKTKKFYLKALPYPMDGLEPVFSEELFQMFYLLQHQSYVSNANSLLEQYDEVYLSGDIKKIREISHAIEYNLGAHFNYQFFWESLAPMKGSGESEKSSDSDSEEEG